jgi:hypothetical protein
MRRFGVVWTLLAVVAVGGVCGAFAAPEVVAPATDSGLIGPIAFGAAAIGSLAGQTGTWAYHTYVVDVPAGVRRLTFSLDADIDLDLVLKYGAEIRGYQDRDQGGDWDQRDLGHDNPTVLVLENPRAGRWFVDVVNGYGAGTTGSYRLAVSAFGGEAEFGAPGADQALAYVPDDCPLRVLLPTAVGSGPPPGLRAGTRLVYFGMSGTIASTRSRLVLDEDGNWIDDATGERYREEPVTGGAGGGFTVLRVGHVDEQVVQVGVRVYAWDIATGVASYASSSGLVTYAGCASDYWVHPLALATLAERNEPGLRILRMPYRVGDHVFDAIRIQSSSESGYTAYVFDLATGLMVFHGSRSTGPAVWTPSLGDRADLGEGSTTLVTIWIVDAADVAVPWADAPVPAWVDRVQALEYEGTMTTFTASAAPLSLALRHVATPDLRGAGWLHLRTSTWLQSVAGMPPGQLDGVDASGTGSIGGLWIAPSALAALAPGQVIDRIAALDVSTTVGAVAPGRVTIVEAGPAHRLEHTYDTTTGVLVALRRVDRGPLAEVVYDLRLVAGP